MANESLSRLQRLQAEAQAMLDERAVAARAESEMPWFHRFVQFWIFVGQNFVRNRCPVRAASLAYTTLLALVPLLAVAISISTSLLRTEKGEEQIETLVDTAITRFAPQLGLVSKAEGDQEDARAKVVEFINKSINNIQSGALGVTATVALLFVGISLLASIETTLNDIWGISRGRTWFWRVVLYWAAITLGPVLLLVGLGLKAGPYFSVTRHMIDQTPFVGNLIYQLLPLVVFVVTLSVFYQLMPNTKVEWRAALVGGAVAGSLLHLNNAFSVIYFGQVVSNSKMYGSLGILPVFLIGLYFSWMILLLGAQVAYAYQNRRAYLQEIHAESINQRGREFIALRIMTLAAERFQAGERPATLTQFANSLAVSSRIISRIIDPLVQTKLMMEVSACGEPERPMAVSQEHAYAPARPLDQISFGDILLALRTGTGEQIATKDDAGRLLVQTQFARIEDAEARAGSAVTLAALVQKT